MQVVGFLSGKGGTAKTTSAITLSAIFATKHKVALIDSDPQASAHEWGSQNDQAFDVFHETSPTVIGMIPGIQAYDYVFIDTAPSLSAVLFNAVQQVVDLIVIPCPPNPMDVKQALKTAKQIDKPFRILVTRVDPRALAGAEALIKTFKNSGLPVFRNFVREYKAFQVASLAGQPITKIKYPYASEGVEDYRKIANELRKVLNG